MNYVDVALEAARAAGRILQEVKDKGPERVDHKGVVDLVTEVDRGCELAVRQVLSRRTPDIAVYAEEGGGAMDAATRWIVDPIDGTTNFVHGFPYYCTSVALQKDGELVVGVVYDPTRDEAFTAERFSGAYINGKRIRVSAVGDLSQALVGTGFPYDRHMHAPRYLAFVQAMLSRCQGVRRAGAAALDLANLAAGRLDAFWEFDLRAWDVAAGALLIREAGGTIQSIGESELVLTDRLSPMASNGLLQQRLAMILDSVAAQGAGSS